MYIHFDTIRECDGQTDGQLSRSLKVSVTLSRSACIGMLTRDKNRQETDFETENK